MYVSALLLAAGKGSRLKSKIPKPLIKINARPLIAYSLIALNRHNYIREIVVVASPGTLEAITKIVKRLKVNKVKNIVLGGARRQDSVLNGLMRLDQKADIVLIHDGARPFIRSNIISLVVNQAKHCGASIVGAPVKATIKSVKVSRCQGVKERVVEKTVDRENLWEIQTPQAFKKELILKAYERFGSSEVTDEAMLVEKLGARVTVVRGDYDNIKITTPEDVVIAEAISRKLNKMKISVERRADSV